MLGIAGAAQLPAMQRAVMRRADGDQVVGAVRATIGAVPEVVNVQEGGVPAPGHPTAALIAQQYRAAQRRRDILLGSREGCGRELLFAATRSFSRVERGL